MSVEYDGGLNTGYDPGAYNTATHVPQDNDTEYSVESTKGVSQKWPSDLQKVGRITPLKALVLVFDVVLASSPIMFLGEHDQSQNDCSRLFWLGAGPIDCMLTCYSSRPYRCQVERKRGVGLWYQTRTNTSPFAHNLPSDLRGLDGKVLSTRRSLPCSTRHNSRPS